MSIQSETIGNANYLSNVKARHARVTDLNYIVSLENATFLAPKTATSKFFPTEIHAHI